MSLNKKTSFPEIGGFSFRLLLPFGNLPVDVLDVLFVLHTIDQKGQHHHHAHVNKGHPEIAWKEPSHNEAEEHHDPGDRKVFHHITHEDRQGNELVKQVIYRRQECGQQKEF